MTTCRVPGGATATSRLASRIGTVRSASPWISSSGTSSRRPIIAIGCVRRGSPPTWRAIRANARSATRRPSGIVSRLATTTDSSGATESPTTATIRGRGGGPGAAGASGSISAAVSRPSPRIATAAMAVMPPIEDPTMATRVTPRSPSQPSAPATSSTSSSPNVVGASSEPPWPRKSSPSTPAVRRRNGARSSRSGVTDPL